MFCEKGVPKNFVKFTGKHLSQSLFFNNVADLMPALLLKIDSNTDVFQLMLSNFYEHLQWLLFRFDEMRLVYVREDTPSEHLTKHKLPYDIESLFCRVKSKQNEMSVMWCLSSSKSIRMTLIFACY